MNRNDTKQIGWLARFLSALVAMLLVSMLIAADAAASPLTQPKADGWIGEQADGYLGLVREDAPAPVKLLVEQ
ncbi:MAG: DUF1318 domain-containing protein, partial [Lysobacterales bacterium]